MFLFIPCDLRIRQRLFTVCLLQKLQEKRELQLINEKIFYVKSKTEIHKTSNNFKKKHLKKKQTNKSYLKTYQRKISLYILHQ